MNLEELLKLEKIDNLSEVVEVLKTKEFEDYKNSGVDLKQICMLLIDNVPIFGKRNLNERFVEKVLSDPAFLNARHNILGDEYERKIEREIWMWYEEKRRNKKKRKNTKRIDKKTRSKRRKKIKM